MKFAEKYKVLNKKSFEKGDFTVIPIRYEDRWDIMKWRNEQMFHLRQAHRLTEEDQENYFSNVIAKLYEEDLPQQLLFSYLYKGKCIGYGGLVHINWLDKNLEMSFLVETTITKNDELYAKCLSHFIALIKEISFQELGFNKLYTETYDLRDHHIMILEKNSFILEGRLRKHILFDGTYYDSLFHSVLKEEYDK